MKVAFESMNVAFARMPKLDSMPSVNALNGICAASSMPFSFAPEPLTVVASVQRGSSCCAGFKAAGDAGLSTDAGKPVCVNVAPVTDADCVNVLTSFWNNATDNTA